MTQAKQLGTALVTGASRGIGAVYAQRLARRGYDLILVARDVARLEVIAGDIRMETGQNVEVVPADLSLRSGLAAIIERIDNDASITMLVNNAGIVLEGGLLDNGASELERLIAVNVTAPTLLAAAGGRAFVSRNHGAIINISSVLAFHPELLDGVYSGSKAHVLSVSLSLATTVAGTPVRVQAVLPGPTRTDIWAHQGVDIDELVPGLVMTTDDLVDAALTGFDLGEVVTIPSLADLGLYTAYEEARLALTAQLASSVVAGRYLQALPQ